MLLGAWRATRALLHAACDVHSAQPPAVMLSSEWELGVGTLHIMVLGGRWGRQGHCSTAAPESNGSSDCMKNLHHVCRRSSLGWRQRQRHRYVLLHPALHRHLRACALSVVSSKWTAAPLRSAFLARSAPVIWRVIDARVQAHAEPFGLLHPSVCSGVSQRAL